MKFNTPQISWHDRQPILSVDIQNRFYFKGEPKWYRVATSGNDFHVIIWKINVTPDDKISIRLNTNVECLAELTQPQRGVNVVRFSPNANDDLLAAGDDDALIFIWKLCEIDDTEEEKLFNLTSDIITIERWKLHKTLRGHTQDVSDLCWSSDGKYLVSGSVDNNVFVWDVNKGAQLRRFNKQHSGYVQGVTWDPLYKYIISLATDRQMIVVDFKKGRIVHRVTKLITDNDKSSDITNGDENGVNKNTGRLFFDHSSMTYFRRLTFTPGGELLLAPSGVFETGPDRFLNVLYIFERNSLNRPSFYLPTTSYSLVVRCCPIVFQLKENVENVFKFPYRYVFAVGTKESVLFYDTQQMSPFAHVSQIHYMSISDISWSPDGRFIIITSNDGFATFIHFDENELGIPYDGKLMELEELEPTPANINTSNNDKIKLKQPSTPSNNSNIIIGSAGNNSNYSTIIENNKIKQIKPTTPITSYFKMSSPSNVKATIDANESKESINGSTINIITNTTTTTNTTITTTTTTNNKNNKESKNQTTIGRRVSLITLSKVNNNNKNENADKPTPNVEEQTVSINLKRKLPDGEDNNENVNEITKAI